MLKALGLWLGVLFPVVAQGASVVFLNPGHGKEDYWVRYAAFMQAAADELGMHLRVEYSDREVATTRDQARQVLESADKPDYLVMVNEQYVAPQILRLAHDSGVKMFLVNNPLTPAQTHTIDAQPQVYAPVLGTLTVNDEQAGFQMLHGLLAKLPASNGTIDLLAFSAVKNTPASQAREDGMRRALADYPQVRLRQVVYGGWSRQRAYEQAQVLVQRYPDARLVWCANDEMAFGAMQAFAEAGREPGRDVLFSAVNASPQALQARIDGRLSVLVGGHFTVGGWAMVMLHDDAHGVPVDRDGQREHTVPALQLIDAAGAQRWLQRLRRPDLGVRFRPLSAEGRGPDYRYPFLQPPQL
ncbi:ABC transporter substrate-binding protein [Pseudomonas cremoricolorata]|uniref:LacI family transcriptional regulator n=1 Tax=Pseudomonas cremoricolorata TaxID=157783 RepID=A0A089WU44_9PSED|nr:ABC transporter substrate-binding protein [Pseudomonas cremoricolorata]AIR90709.1 LacI family transcriptional regulator [Pseudomonas cremoricolorata]